MIQADLPGKRRRIEKRCDHGPHRLCYRISKTRSSQGSVRVIGTSSVFAELPFRFTPGAELVQAQGRV